MKIREIFDAMNVTTSDYANLYCVVKNIYDVIVRRSYQEKISCLYISISTCMKHFKNVIILTSSLRHRYDSDVLRLLR